ncbi:hypothetical protein CLV24_112108 [Pontibacter ummariensis]|uniref:DKNYY family protein n=1 Tax=Pontibacter ummariensis TaxID=1610492 RepID=A0A239GXW8_9BACT|nr:hypothetical protein [Pontibacter ummariensis]PRY10981.1 hypothetical protein CLV24_112108 [Pontibacter ummariensis]SNS73752.1 hypothetical protein SAMN06296052_11270 [Pontibacter ummariensis]
MRKLLLSLLLTGAFATGANAQKEFANIDLPMNRAEDLVSVADDNGNVAIYFYQSGRLNFSLLSPNGEKIAQHEIPYRYAQDPQILGTRVSDEEFIFYSRYTNGRREFLRPFAINRRTGAFRSPQDEQIKLGRNTTFLGGFGDKEHFYMLYTDKDENLHLYRDTEEDVAHLEHRVFKTNMPRTRERYARESGLIYVHEDLEHNVFTGHHRSKIYTRDDKVYMIFDGYDLRGKDDETTEILTLDWNTGETNYRTLPAIAQKGNTPTFNSFLYKDKLFRLHVEKDQLQLTAYDFNSLKPIKEYNYSGDEEISIKSTPVQQRGAKALFSSDEDVIEKPSKVMRALANGVPAITVDAYNDSTLQLTIGSYRAPREGNSFQDRSRMVRTPDRYVRTSRGLMMIPGRWTPAYTIPSYYLNSPYYSRFFYDPYGQWGTGGYVGPGTSTYFRSILDANDLSKAASDKELVVLQDKIDEFEKDLKPEPEFKTVYRYGDKLHYGYYDRKARTFRIMEFAQNQEKEKDQPEQP